MAKIAHRRGRTWPRAIFEWSPLLWPLVFLFMALVYAPPVPIHWAWDSFLYVSAVHDGSNHVYLGWGRTLFLLMGHGVRELGAVILWPSLFTTWRMWLGVGLVTHAFLLAPIAIALTRRLGPLAAHVALGLFVLHPQQFVVLIGVWAENPALAAFLLAALVLLPGSWHWKARGAGSLALAVVMTLLKEVNLYFVPFLALLFFWQLPAFLGWWRRLLHAGGYFLLGVGVPLLCYHVLLPTMIPGLTRTRGYLLENYLAIETVGWGAWMLIAERGFQALLRSGMIIPFGVLSLIAVPWMVLLIRGGDRRLQRAHLPAITLTAVLIGAPVVVLLGSGQADHMDRQVLALVPGLCLLAALPWSRPLSPMLSRSLGVRIVLAAVAVALMLSFSKWSMIRDYAYHSWEDQERYIHMETLLEKEMGLWVGADSWPALYIMELSGKAPRPGRWDILWPDWARREGDLEAARWRTRQLEAGRAIAISPSVLQRAGLSTGELPTRFPGYVFTSHPSGWLIGEAP